MPQIMFFWDCFYKDLLESYSSNFLMYFALQNGITTFLLEYFDFVAIFYFPMPRFKQHSVRTAQI